MRKILLRIWIKLSNRISLIAQVNLMYRVRKIIVPSPKRSRPRRTPVVPSAPRRHGFHRAFIAVVAFLIVGIPLAIGAFSEWAPARAYLPRIIRSVTNLPVYPQAQQIAEHADSFFSCGKTLVLTTTSNFNKVVTYYNDVLTAAGWTRYYNIGNTFEYVRYMWNAPAFDEYPSTTYMINIEWSVYSGVRDVYISLAQECKNVSGVLN